MKKHFPVRLIIIVIIIIIIIIIQTYSRKCARVYYIVQTPNARTYEWVGHI
jgi:hypothetical protein